MVGNFCNRTACRIRNRRRRHDNNMTLRKKKTPRASQHYMGWRARQKSLLLPVAGEFFLLTLPFIERAYRRCAPAVGVDERPRHKWTSEVPGLTESQKPYPGENQRRKDGPPARSVKRWHGILQLRLMMNTVL